VTTCDITTSIGAYLLGSLESGEWVTIDQHVRECEVCQADLVRLAGLPGLMAQLSIDEVIADVIDQPTTATTIPRSPRTLRKWLATAALIIAIAGSVAGGLLARTTGPSPAAGPSSVRSQTFTLTGSNTTTRVRGSASLRAESWGTEIWVTLHGVPGGVQCALVVRARDGRSVVGGTWSSGNSTAGVWVPASAPFRPSQIASLEVATPTKRLITLISNVHGPAHQALTSRSAANAKDA
jgi:hypothetical protein